MTNPYKNINELREWLKANSSGVYRPAAHAATVIEEQDSELTTLRAENDRLRAKLAAMESQKPDCWRITHQSFCGIVTDKKEIAEDPFYSGCVFPLYAKPVPADKPARITEQDAREIITQYAIWRGTEYSESTERLFISGWLELDGNGLIEKLNADRKVPAVAVPTYPMQPIIKDARGLDRFEANPIVDMLVERVGLNEIDVWWQVNNIPAKYMEQLAQLIGYSVRGYGTLSYVSDESYALAEKLAAAPSHSQDPKGA